MGTISYIFIAVFILHFALAQQSVENITAFFNQQLNLKCESNLSQNVEWSVLFGPSYIPTFICRGDNECGATSEGEVFVKIYDLAVNRTADASFLSLSPKNDALESLKCKRSGDDSERIYNLILEAPTNITEYCKYTLPSIREDLNITLSCGYNSSRRLVSNLTLEQLGENNFEIHRSSQSINGTLHFAAFSGIHNASCKLYFPNIDVTKYCTYPTVVQTKYTIEGNAVIIKCGDESDGDWHLIDSDGKERDIEKRSWTRQGGRFLLVKDISEQDIGKVIVCRSNSKIFFTVLSDDITDSNKSDSDDSDRGPKNGHKNTFFVPTLLFLTLWLITTAIFGVWFGCRSKKSKFSSSASGNTSNAEPNVTGGASDRETPLVNVRTGVRGDPDTSNTNNSASNSAFELEGEGPDENRLNRQSNNGSHLYFTLEKPSPSTESSRMVTTSGIDRREDTNLASPNQPHSSHWQGYETVGESDKGAACSYDLGEYAEVGDHHNIGRSLTDRSVRPSIPKKPVKEEIKENDISRLYSQVNK